MSVKPTTLKTELDSALLNSVAVNTLVKDPIWINNQTRLNESNMNNLRNRLISYSDGTLKSAYRNLAQSLNTLMLRTAGWNSFEESDLQFRTPIGAIFNDYDNNIASGKFSAAFGTHTKATSDGQFVMGKYNAEDANALFVIGNGEAEDNRSNIFTVKQNGVTEAVKMSVKQSPTALTHVVRKKELDALRSEITGALHYVGVTKSLTIQDESGVKIVTAESPFKIFDYYNEDTKENIFKDIALSDGDVAVIGKWLNSSNEEVAEGTEGAIFTATGDECIYKDGKWTYYGAYANYVPSYEFEQALDKKADLINPTFDGEVVFNNTDNKNNTNSPDSTPYCASFVENVKAYKNFNVGSTLITEKLSVAQDSAFKGNSTFEGSTSFTGKTTAPTLESTTNNSQVATTKFVHNCLSDISSYKIVSTTTAMTSKNFIYILPETSDSGTKSYTAYILGEDNKPHIIAGTGSGGGGFLFTEDYDLENYESYLTNTTDAASVSFVQSALDSYIEQIDSILKGESTENVAGRVALSSSPTNNSVIYKQPVEDSKIIVESKYADVLKTTINLNLSTNNSSDKIQVIINDEEPIALGESIEGSDIFGDIEIVNNILKFNLLGTNTGYIKLSDSITSIDSIEISSTKDSSFTGTYTVEEKYQNI